MSNPDPYGVRKWEESQRMYQQESSQEDLLYEELLCAYQALPDAAGHHSRTSNPDHWGILNNTMDTLVKMGHAEYDRFKISPEHPHYNGMVHTEANITSIKMKMMQALGRMGTEFGSGNPAYDLSQFKNTGGGGVSVSQTANPYMHQEQHQEMAVNIQQAAEKTLEYMKQNYPEEKILEASEVLEPLKKGDTAWPKVKRAVDFFVGLGREAFFAFAPVLLQLHLQQVPMPQ